MAYDVLYINGCSYQYSSAPGRKTDTVGELLARKLGIPKVVSNARMGSCNSRIVRTSIRDTIDLSKEHKNILALVGFSYPWRKELWVAKWEDADERYDNTDGLYESQGLLYKEWVDYAINVKHRGTPLEGKLKEEVAQKFGDSDSTELLQQGIMLYHTLRATGVTPIIFSSVLQPRANYKVPHIATFYREMKECEPYVIDLLHFNMLDYLLHKGHKPHDWEEHGHSGHPDLEGHKAFAEFLYDEYKGNLW